MKAGTVPYMLTADLGVDFIEIKMPRVAIILTVFEPGPALAIIGTVGSQLDPLYPMIKGRVTET